jgi:pyridoxine 5-phosphate synthase
MTRLSVNINKIATIRNARGGNIPDVLMAAINCEKFGAQGITVHPRPDERHIRYQDVREIRPVITTEFNIEGYPLKKFIDLVLEVRPDQADAITSSQGWDTIKNLTFLTEVISEFRRNGIRTSIFIGTEPENIENAAKTGTDRIELYTEPYVRMFHENRKRAVEPFIKAAGIGKISGLQLNAGHDLNLDNLKYFHQSIPELAEVSIGHALISDALYFGLQKTIHLYLEQLK